MNHERAILSAIVQSRQAYDLIAGRLGEEDLSEHGRIVYKGAQSYYDKDVTAEACDQKILTNAINRKMAGDKHKETFTKLIAELFAGKVSAANIMADFFAMKREDAGARLASALLSGKDGEIDELIEDYERWKEPSDSDDTPDHEVVSGLSVEELVGTRLNEDNLVKVLPKSLNDRLDGGLLPGNHVVVFARPEAGKTMLVINMMAGFVRQGLKVLYVGNEDPLADIVMRAVCRLSGFTKAEVVTSPAAADAKARDAGYGLVTFASLAPGTPREVEKLIKEHEPKVIIIDQLRNLSMKEDNTVVKLEKAATAVRTLCKRYGVVGISVTQAGDSASGKAVLDMGDVDFSNTGIPATADVMVGLGMSHDDELADRRVISLPKNKRGGVHDYFPVGVDRMRSKVVSLE
jgi:KaiC/GvpD/RAD55 family RecA-like ATPase